MDLWLSYLNFSKRHQTLGIFREVVFNGAKLVMFRMFLQSSGRALVQHWFTNVYNLSATIDRDVPFLISLFVIRSMSPPCLCWVLEGLSVKDYGERPGVLGIRDDHLPSEFWGFKLQTRLREVGVGFDFFKKSFRIILGIVNTNVSFSNQFL